MQQPGPGAGTDVKLTGEGLNFSMGCNSLNSRPCRTMDSGLTIFPGARGNGGSHGAKGATAFLKFHAVTPLRRNVLPPGESA